MISLTVLKVERVRERVRGKCPFDGHLNSLTLWASSKVRPVREASRPRRLKRGARPLTLTRSTRSSIYSERVNLSEFEEDV